MLHSIPQAKNRSRFPVVFGWREWNSTACPSAVHTRSAAPCASRVSSHSDPKRPDPEAAQAAALVRLFLPDITFGLAEGTSLCYIFSAAGSTCFHRCHGSVSECWIEIFDFEDGMCMLFRNGCIMQRYSAVSTLGRRQHSEYIQCLYYQRCLSLTRDKWVPVTTAWRVLKLRMEERLPIWRLSANTLNKQSRKAE
jgi:hypothetical protein